MTVCEFCNTSLNESVLAVDAGGNQFKSCPKCSSDAGCHVFYRYDDFGMRNMGDGRHTVQSWCPGCRSDDGIRPEVTFNCKE